MPDTTEQLPSPKIALYMGLLPGGGQLYNHRWVKFGIALAAQGFFTYNFLENRERYYNYADYEESLPLERHRYLTKRNKYGWWMGLAFLWGLADGYVDAHLAGFPSDSLNIRPPVDTIQEFE